MIINRNDHNVGIDGQSYGVGWQIMEKSSYDEEDVSLILSLLGLCRRYNGDGVLAIDCGANVGVHTVEWGRFTNGWGTVLAFEAQEYIYYALAGNTVINNCFNVSVHHCALGAVNGILKIPELDYTQPASFGSFELRKNAQTEEIGQPVCYDQPSKEIRQVALDSLALSRVDLIKIDVEGMEEDVLIGAKTLIDKNLPVMFIETLKSSDEKLMQFLLNRGYKSYPTGINLLAVHSDSELLKHIEFKDCKISVRQNIS